MLDLTSRFGRRVSRRLRQEQIIWLTTVDVSDTPQPRPVWFHWDGRAALILSQAKAAKVRHVARNPNVALNFNSDEDGGDIAVLIGTARILKKPAPPARMKAYLRKYRRGIRGIGMTVPGFTADYAVPILVTPNAMRGF